MPVSVCISVGTWLYVHANLCGWAYVYISIYGDIRTYTHTHINILLYAYVLSARVNVCMHIYVYVYAVE